MADPLHPPPGTESGGARPESGQSQSAGSGRIGIRPLAGAVLVVALAAFVVQNGESTAVRWLWFDGSAPLFGVIVVSALAGAVLSEIVGWSLRRRRRRREQR